MSKSRRIVITGIGPLTSSGTGVKSFWDSLLGLKFYAEPIPSEFTGRHDYKSKYYVPFSSIDIGQLDIPRKYMQVMGESTVLAVAGTAMAMEDAGFDLANNDIENSFFEDARIIVGTGIGSMKSGFESYIAHCFSDNAALREELGHQARFNRMGIPMLMPNAISSWISILYGIHGGQYTLNASCSSGSLAIIEACKCITGGECDLVVTGGVECLQDDHGCIMRGFDGLGTLTRSETGMPMPFSESRSGFLFSEGACCMLILEELESALQRGAHIYAEIVSTAISSDAYSIVQIDPRGEQIEKMIRKVVKGERVDYLNAHGTATILNDEVERNIIRSVFGNREEQPLINSTKGILGHTIGASGAIEVAVTALSLKHQKVHGNLTEDPFDDLNLVSSSCDCALDTALTVSYGFGGHNGGILLKKYGR